MKATEEKVLAWQEELKRRAKERDLSYRNISLALGVTSAQVSNWFNGLSPIPQHRLSQLCDMLGGNLKNWQAYAFLTKLFLERKDAEEFIENVVEVCTDVGHTIMNGTGIEPQDMHTYNITQLPVDDKAFRVENPPETVFPNASYLICCNYLPKEGLPCLIVDSTSTRAAYYYGNVSEEARVYTIHAPIFDA